MGPLFRTPPDGGVSRSRSRLSSSSRLLAVGPPGKLDFPPLMRFYEYESRKIVERAAIPVTRYGFCTTPQEARVAAEQIGGSVVVKSQVLTGGRMKAGGVRFADSPEAAEADAAEILELEINGQMPRGVLVDPKAEVAQEYYAGVVWDGTRKQPLMLFSDMGGIDIEQVGRASCRERVYSGV